MANWSEFQNIIYITYFFFFLKKSISLLFSCVPYTYYTRTRKKFIDKYKLKLAAIIM